ncbi:helix-turn-helix domain-containing protein [Bacillus songklensis]|uniref:Helix-turn-helix domain-containing protein n=1 Tax=Bacillus songklensis TaxID=1069116 RepID=A0ABV8B2L2_9BACI
MLKTLSRYACKIVGAAFLKVDTIAQLTEIAKRTVQRALKLLESYGVIERRATVRKGGGNGHNVYFIVCGIGLLLLIDAKVLTNRSRI